MADNQELSLKWNNHSISFLQLLKKICMTDMYSDVTLVCHGEYFPVHRLVLAGCSEYFEDILSHTPCRHPFIVIKDIKPTELKCLLTYMYHGEADTFQDNIPELLRAADDLKIKGLVTSGNESPTKKRKTLMPAVKFQQRKKLKSVYPVSESAPPDGSLDEANKILPESSTDPLILIPMAESSLQEDIPLVEVKLEDTAAESTSKFESYGDDNLGDEQSNSTEDLIASMPLNPLQDIPHDHEIWGESSTVSDTETQEALDKDNSKSTRNLSRKDRLKKCSISSKSKTKNQNLLRGGYFPCPFCTRVSSQLCNLNVHIMRCHTGEKPHQCPFCPNRFTTSGQAKIHVMRRHTGEKPYSCLYCSYKCVAPTQLKLHVRTHTGEKPFKCPFCEHRTARKTGMQIHIKRRHQEEVSLGYIP